MLDRSPAHSPTLLEPDSPKSPKSPCAVKLIDFDTLSPKSTKPTEIVGTNGYIAPEAADDSRQTYFFICWLFEK